jgi:hypothetical protein
MEDYKNYKVLEAMTKYGGGFVKSLAECCYRADRNNYKILETAFKEYFDEYNNTFVQQ